MFEILSQALFPVGGTDNPDIRGFRLLAPNPSDTPSSIKVRSIACTSRGSSPINRRRGRRSCDQPVHGRGDRAPLPRRAEGSGDPPPSRAEGQLGTLVARRRRHRSRPVAARTGRHQRASPSPAAARPSIASMTPAFIHFMGADELLAEEGPDALAAALDFVMRSVQRAADDHQVGFFETDIARERRQGDADGGRAPLSGNDEERMLRAMRAVIDAEARCRSASASTGAHLRRRLRSAVPADVLGQGRRGQPRGAPDGEGRAGPAAHDGRRSGSDRERGSTHWHSSRSRPRARTSRYRRTSSALRSASRSGARPRRSSVAKTSCRC